MVQGGGLHVRRGEAVDGNAEGGEGPSQGGSLSEPRARPAWGDEGGGGGDREGVGAPGGP